MEGRIPGMPAVRSALDSAVGRYLWRPWYDDVATPAISKMFFPLSRAWATGLDANGDPARFHTAMNDGAPRRMVGARLIGLVDRAHRRYRSALSDWEHAAFKSAWDDPAALAALERARLVRCRQMMGLRVGFLPGHLERPFPAIGFSIDPADTVEARHGTRRGRPDAGMTPDLEAPVTVSAPAAMDGAIWRWLRFAAPDGVPGLAPAEARLREPSAAAPRATMIFAHGIGMEPEMWGEQDTMGDWFLAQGFRVIEPQGPWHSRRAIAGCYGGEPIFARGPGGLLDYSWTHVREIGRLAAWARDRDRAARRAPLPILLVGISLGALTMMQVLSWSHTWPADAQPDSAVLISPAASLVEVAYRGSLTGGMGVPAALDAAGWTEPSVAAWAPLLDAADTPSTAPSRTILVLGTEDEITPYASGEDLARRWAIPAENLWLRRQGHFTVSLGLPTAPAPLKRAVDVTLE